MTPHKKKQADQEVMTLIIKRKGHNAKRELFIFLRRKTKTTKKLCFAN